MNRKTANIIRWITVLPAHLLLPILLVNPIIFYNTPFVIADHRFIPFYNVTGMLFFVVAFVAALIIAPSHKRIVFWILFACWSSFGVYSCWSRISVGYTNYVMVGHALPAIAVLLLFGILNKTNFRVWPTRWKYRLLLLVSAGIVFGLASFSLKISEWYHGQKFKALPEIVYDQLGHVDEWRFWPCKQLHQRPIEIKAWCTMYPDIPGEYNLDFATPYYFKFRGGEGYLAIFHKRAPDHEQAEAFWLDVNGKCWVIGSRSTTSPDYRKYWTDEIQLPNSVYDALCYFELEKNSKCSMVGEFPQEVLDWHPDIYEIIDREIYTESATPHFFKNEKNEYLLIWDYIQNLYLWVDSNEVRNRTAEYREKSDFKTAGRPSLDSARCESASMPLEPLSQGRLNKMLEDDMKRSNHH